MDGRNGTVIKASSHHLVILVSVLRSSSSLCSSRAFQEQYTANLDATGPYTNGHLRWNNAVFFLTNHVLTVFSGYIHQTTSTRTGCHHTAICRNDPRRKRAQWKGMFMRLVLEMERLSSSVVPYSVGTNWQGSGRPHGREAKREAVFLARRTNCPNNVIAKSKLYSYFVMRFVSFQVRSYHILYNPCVLSRLVPK